METPSQIRFPWDELLPDAALAAGTSVIALFCTIWFASYLGPQYCVTMWNDHVSGGTQDQFTMLVAGTAFGGTAVFCVRRMADGVVNWRTKRRGSRVRVLPDM